MKQAFIYSLKVYITGNLIAILFSGIVCYNLHHETYNSFGVSYRFLFQMFASQWAYILFGSIIGWLIIIKIVQVIGSKDWSAFKKRRGIFLAVEGLTVLLFASLALLARGSEVVPWILVWLISSASFAMSVMIYGPRPSSGNGLNA